MLTYRACAIVVTGGVSIGIEILIASLFMPYLLGPILIISGRSDWRKPLIMLGNLIIFTEAFFIIMLCGFRYVKSIPMPIIIGLVVGLATSFAMLFAANLLVKADDIHYLLWRQRQKEIRRDDD